MFLFKTSGETFASMIEHQSHACASKQRSWEEGELVLVSKNNGDLHAGEKQIKYVTRLRNMSEILPGEAGEYWPATKADGGPCWQGFRVPVWLDSLAGSLRGTQRGKQPSAL